MTRWRASRVPGIISTQGSTSSTKSRSLPSGWQSLPESPARVLSGWRARWRAAPWIGRCRFRLRLERQDREEIRRAPAIVPRSSRAQNGFADIPAALRRRHGFDRSFRHSFPLTGSSFAAPSARRTAVQIFRYPVQRQICPLRYWPTSGESGWMDRLIMLYTVISHPGVQYPHCKA